MDKLKFLTTTVFTGSLILGSLVTSPLALSQGEGVCTAPGLEKNRITISVTDENGTAVTRVTPFEVSFPDPGTSGPRNGNQKHIIICLEGATFVSGQEVVWSSRNPPSPSGEFSRNSSGQHGTWYMLNNANSVANTYDFSVTVDTVFGRMVIDPRVKNGGGGHIE